METICATFAGDDDLCCRCGQQLPASVTDWWLSDPVHVFCSASCAQAAS